jgi:L-ribulose-5-phosphate 3-epimerase
MSDLDRRTFLRSSAAFFAGGGLLATGACASTAAARAGSTGSGQLFDISLAQWSLNRTLRAGELDNLEFAGLARERFGIEAVEYVNQFFMDRARDTAYLSQMKQRAEDAGVRNVLIMCDNEGMLGDPDEARRLQAVENHHKWVDAARFLGCHSIRVNAASRGSYDEQLALAADGLRRLAEYGETQGINVIVENHGGLSSNGKWLSAVMERVDHPRAGTLPDFGNFRIGGGRGEPEEWYDRYVGVAELMPYAKGVSAKSNEFDAQGNEVRTDFRRMMRIVLDAGYRGYVGIEYEGEIPEMEGIQKTKDLLVRVRDELEPVYA